MDAQQLKVFIDAMAGSDLAELEASKDGWTLRLVRDAARARDARDARVARVARAGDGHAAQAGAAIADGARNASVGALDALDAPPGALVQRAALCGVVFLQPAPGEPSFAEPGQAVRAGQTLCVIEAMKVFNEVQAERDGVLDAFLVASGQDVDAGQPLLRLRLR